MAQGVSTEPPSALLWVFRCTTSEHPFLFCLQEGTDMTQILRGNIVHAPEMGRLDILEHGCLVLEDGIITGL